MTTEQELRKTLSAVLDVIDGKDTLKSYTLKALQNLSNEYLKQFDDNFIKNQTMLNNFINIAKNGDVKSLMKVELPDDLDYNDWGQIILDLAKDKKNIPTVLNRVKKYAKKYLDNRSHKHTYEGAYDEMMDDIVHDIISDDNLELLLWLDPNFDDEDIIIEAAMRVGSMRILNYLYDRLGDNMFNKYAEEDIDTIELDMKSIKFMEEKKFKYNIIGIVTMNLEFDVFSYLIDKIDPIFYDDILIKMVLEYDISREGIILDNYLYIISRGANPYNIPLKVFNDSLNHTVTTLTAIFRTEKSINEQIKINSSRIFKYLLLNYDIKPWPLPFVMIYFDSVDDLESLFIIYHRYTEEQVRNDLEEYKKHNYPIIGEYCRDRFIHSYKQYTQLVEVVLSELGKRYYRDIANELLNYLV